MQGSRSEPRKLADVIADVCAHPDYEKLPPLVKAEFEGASWMLTGTGGKENRAFCRAMWRHLYQGGPFPNS